MQTQIQEIKIKCAEHGANNKSMAKDIQDIKSDVKEIKEAIKELNNVFVTKIEFEPIRTVVYGMIGFILLAFLGVIVSLVMN